MEKRRKPGIVLIGSGNMGTRLGTALHHAGYPIVQVYSRTREQADRLAQELGCAGVTEPEAISMEAEVVLSVLKDSAAAEIWPRVPFADRLTLHTAGSLPMSALAPYSRNYGVLYPLQTLSKGRAVEFDEVPLLIEANTGENLERVRMMAEDLSRTVREVNSEQRKAIHLAAVFANNFSNHMFELAGKLLEKHGLPFELLLPIIDETARKVHELKPHEAQTGPAVRYDRNVIESHMRQLADEPELRAIYELVSASIHTSR